MPKYEFRCNDTGKLFEITASYQEYDPTKVVSPFTGSSNVSRLIRRIRVMRSDSSRWDRMMDGDESALNDLEDADPRTLGRALRHFSRQMDVGEDMQPEFNEVIDRLESGQSPEEIEQTMDMADSGGSDDL
ncbi:MAG: zinc ribbon domain-containing protein [Anaerolineales bacterium]|nr:zinc ribbon domain-containing protein [Anaerolineales bacterium]